MTPRPGYTTTERDDLPHRDSAARSGVPSGRVAPLHLDRAAVRVAAFGHALLFVLGFSTVFVVGWGGAATALGQLFVLNKAMLGRVGGVVVILFGLHRLGVLNLRWLNYDLRPTWRGPGWGGQLSSALMGVVFAAGWTPCVGTILGAILTLGLSQPTSGQAMALASGYALGMGLPFLAISLLLGQAATVTRRLQRHMRAIEIFSSLLLVAMGLLMLTDRMFYLAIWAQRQGLFLDLRLGQVATPAYLVAVLGGLLSFLSPCVLPLVPAYVGYLSGGLRPAARPLAAESGDG